jgi:hypothetical protein
MLQNTVVIAIGTVLFLVFSLEVILYAIRKTVDVLFIYKSVLKLDSWFNKRNRPQKLSLTFFVFYESAHTIQLSIIIIIKLL